MCILAYDIDTAFLIVMGSFDDQFIYGAFVNACVLA